MTKAEFVIQFSELIADLKEFRGSIVLEAASGDGGDWDAARAKQGAQLAAYFWDRFDRETNEYLLVRIGEYVRDANFCRETDPDRGKCRPIVTIDEHGSPTCELER